MISRAFVTSDDGPRMYQYLDEFFSGRLAAAIANAALPVQAIATCLVNVTEGTKARLWLNFPHVLTMVTKRLGRIDRGAHVYLDDVADVRAAILDGVELPSRGAIAYTFQHGWRRGFYFDFSAHEPTAGDPNGSIQDLPAVLGWVHGALLLRDRVRFDDDTLETMFAAGWFPFIRLPNDLVVLMRNHVESGWALGELDDKIVEAMAPVVSQVVETWRYTPAFSPHHDVLEEAGALFARGEYRAASALLLPKVEGVLRTMQPGKGRVRSAALCAGLVDRVRARVSGQTAYLPEAFARYLERYYYAGFDLDAGVVPASRHAFMHGVGPDAEMAKPAFALRLLLTLDQLFFYATSD